MNSIHDNDRKDADLVDELENVDRIYRHIEQTEPPELVDQAVLNSARRAIEKKPRLMRPGWMQAVTTVALFGLAISIILKYPDSDISREDGIHSNGQLLPVAEEERLSRGGSQVADDRDKQPPSKQESSLLQADASEDAASPRVEVQGFSKTRKIEQTRSEFRAGRQVNEPATPRSSSAELSSAEQAPDPAAIAEAAVPTEIDFQDADETIESRLAKILALKQAGDENWEKELEQFLTDFPDYELPDSLKPVNQ